MEDIIKFLIPRISKEGYTIIGFAATITLLSFLFFDKLFYVSLIASLFCVYFFRDPVRITPIGDNLVISPADGVISAIDRNIS